MSVDNGAVAVIVPVYNVEKYVSKCLESIINQTYRNLEIVLVDDGSTDASGEICDTYKNIDKRITIYHNENHGLSYARNYGVDNSKAPFLFFVDSDDYLELDAIEYLMKLLSETDAQIACGDAYNDFTDRNEIKPWHQDEDRYLYLSSEKAVEDMFYSEHFDDSVWNKIYKRQLVESVRFPEDRVQAEEAATTYKIMLLADNIVVGLQCKYHYVMHKSGLSRGEYKPSMMLMQQAGLECIEYIKKYHPSIIKAAERRYVYDCFWVLRRIMPVEKSYKKEVNYLINEIAKYRVSVMQNKRAKIRDKIAIVILIFGKRPFSIAWNIYCGVTKR